MSDLISRLDVLQLIRTLPPEEGMTKGLLEMSVKQLPSADASLMQDRCKIDASSDLISRQNAIDAVCEYCEYFNNEKILERIKSLPSAEPERKGKWKAKSFHECFCDNCGFSFDIMHCDFLENMKYCPNCGADMRGKQNDTRDE